MRSRIIYITACLFCLCLVLSADDQPPAQDAGGATDVLVYHVQNTPPDQVAASLRSLFGDNPSLRISAAPNGKTLLMRVESKLKESVLQALEDLDPPSSRLAVQLALVKRVADAEAVDLNSLSGPADDVWNAVRDLERAGRVHVSDRMQTTALSDQQTMIMSGQQLPVATGAVTTVGGTSATYRQQNVGTILTFQGRAAADGTIVCQVAFEKSELVQLPDTPIATGIPSTRTDTATMQSTVSLQSGNATLLSASGSRGSDQQDSYLILSVTVLKPGEMAVANLFERGSRPAPAPPPSSAFGSTRRPTDNGGGRFGPQGPPSGTAGGFRQFGGTGTSSGRFGGASSFGGSRRPTVGLLATISRDEVVKSLELTEAQQTQVAELVEQDQASRAERSQNARDVFERMRAASSDEEREKIRNELSALASSDAAETEQKLTEILSSDSFARLKQLDLQYAGYRALARADVESALSLTAEQRSGIQGAVRGFSRSRFGGGAGERPSPQDLERQMNEAAFAVLTDEQRQTWLEMAGKIVVDNGVPKE